MTDHTTLNTDRRGRKWHFERTLNLGHIISVIALAIPMLIWAWKIDERVSLLEQSQLFSSNERTRIEAQGTEKINSVQLSINRLEMKADRILEHMATKGK